MGIAKKTDGRYLVGIGVDSVNDYKGSAAYRDIYIQLTSSGATAKSEEYLTFLKDYGFHANASGEPIMPPSVNVWISNNGVTTAVEADDVSIDGNNYTICGIKWNGSAWDYTNAGQGSGVGSSLPSYSSADKGKVLTIGEDESIVIVPNQTTTTEGGLAPLANVNVSALSVGMVCDCTLSIAGRPTITDSLTVESYEGALALLGDDVQIGSTEETGWVVVAQGAPDGTEITITVTGKPVSAKWSGARFETIYDSNGVEVASASFYNGMVTISSYGSGTSLSRLTTVQLPVPDSSYADGLGVTRLISVVFSTDSSVVKGYLYIDRLGHVSYSGTSATTIYFTPITYKVAE